MQEILANYAGIVYLNTGKFTEAIDYLSKFKSDDIVLSALGKVLLVMHIKRTN
jgi:hypothetical protein